MSKIQSFLQEKIKRFYTRVGHTSLLEKIGIIAIMLLVFNLFFSIEFSIQRKPLLDKLLNQPADRSDNSSSSLNPVNGVDRLNSELTDLVLPPQGITLPVSWGDLGQQLIAAGVIDQEKIESLYAARGGISPVLKKLLYQNDSAPLQVTTDNASDLLNVLWALGLGNKNDILDKGEMVDSRYGGAGGFASTGGWTLAKGDAMQHYSKHPFLKLTAAQQEVVERVAKNIYRPCCDNSTHFPDCNHGMAMLGLLELMAAQGVSEADMYQAALAVNSYWFPDTYLTIAKYLQNQNKLGQTTAQEILGANYSSATGYRQILSQVEPVSGQGGQGGCGV